MLDLPLDEHTFIVEVTDQVTLPPDVPAGSLCAFRRNARSCTDGELVLAYEDNSDSSTDVPYSVKRYREETYEEEGLVFRRQWLESVASRCESRTDLYEGIVVAQFVGILE